MPKKVQSLWIGTLSPVERLSITSFLNRGFSYDLYVYGDVGPVPQGTQLKDGNEILPAREIFAYTQAAGPGKGSVSAFSNFFRYKLLFDRGGIWVDTDVVCTKTFDVSDEHLFASARRMEGGTLVATCFIQAPRNSPILDYCWKICLGKNREALKWGETGPLLLAEAVSAFGAQSSVCEPEMFCPIGWWDVESHLLGTVPHASITARTCTVHLCNEMWRRNNFSKHDRPRPGSTYEWLVNQNQEQHPGHSFTRYLPAAWRSVFQRKAA